jgi:hypothetical protein
MQWLQIECFTSLLFPKPFLYSFNNDAQTNNHNKEQAAKRISKKTQKKTRRKTVQEQNTNKKHAECDHVKKQRSKILKYMKINIWRILHTWRWSCRPKHVVKNSGNQHIIKLKADGDLTCNTHWMTHALSVTAPDQLFSYAFPCRSLGMRQLAPPPPASKGGRLSQLQPCDQALVWPLAWERISLVVILI